MGLPLVQALVRLLSGPLGGRHTLLAVCPNSAAVTRAALRAAREANAPLLYAATLNQVDTDGGYTGWTPQALANFVQEERARQQLDVPVVLCLDHGGPWKKDLHALNDLSYKETMSSVKRSLEACLDAGYGLLHLDPTVDRRLPPDMPVPVATIVERTVELLEHAETYRVRQQYPPVAYEVGTEEAGGGLESVERFGAFVDQLGVALDACALPYPSFIVGDVGTKLDTSHFDPDRARQLTEQAQPLGARIKGHYTDGVAHPEAYPLSGMGGANVGPGFAAEEYKALMDLVSLERQLGHDSGFADALQEAVVESERWKKWLRPDEADHSFDALPSERQAWLTETGSRYVWTHPSVEAARQRLYQNVSTYRDADAFVLWRIEEAILRYFHAFNLIDFNDRLLEHLPTSAVEIR